MAKSRDSFFLWTAVAIAATVFAGFWFTYFGPIIGGDRAADVGAVHVHGWTFFAWYALLVLQSALVRTRRTSLHRTLGGLSVALAVMMVATGLLVIGVRMADAAETGDPFWSTSGPAVFATLVLFVAFYVAALRMRTRADWHKRLMIIASVGGMGAATFRLCMVMFGPDSAMWLGLLGSNVFIVAGDRARPRGRRARASGVVDRPLVVHRAGVRCVALHGHAVGSGGVTGARRDRPHVPVCVLKSGAVGRSAPRSDERAPRQALRGSVPSTTLARASFTSTRGTRGM